MSTSAYCEDWTQNEAKLIKWEFSPFGSRHFNTTHADDCFKCFTLNYFMSIYRAIESKVSLICKIFCRIYSIDRFESSKSSHSLL